MTNAADKTAVKLFPNSPTMQQRWLKAKEIAKNLKPKYGMMLPLYEEVARIDLFTKRVDR